MEKGDLYKEFVTSVSDAQVDPVHVVKYDQWLRIWKEHFDRVKIVKFKNVDSKVIRLFFCAAHAHKSRGVFSASTLHVHLPVEFPLSFTSFVRIRCGHACGPMHARRWAAQCRNGRW